MGTKPDIPPSPESDDESLVRAYIEHQDVRAFEILYDRYHLRLYNMFLRRFGDAEAAADLTQEVFFRFIRRQKSYRTKNRFSGYLLTIAFRLMLDAERYRSRRRRWLRSHISNVGPVEGEGVVQEIVHREQRETLQACLQRLPSQQFQVLDLVKFQGYSYRAAARLLGITENAARQKVYRALRSLKKMMTVEKEA